MASLQARTLVIHEKYSDVTAETSENVLRELLMIYRVLKNAPDWFARAVPVVSEMAGVSQSTVYQIWKYFKDTDYIYVS